MQPRHSQLFTEPGEFRHRPQTKPRGREITAGVGKAPGERQFPRGQGRWHRRNSHREWECRDLIPPGMLQWVWGSTSSQIPGFHPAFPAGLDPRVQFCNTNGILSSYLGKNWEFCCQEGTTFPQENLPLPGPYSTKIPLASQIPWGFPVPGVGNALPAAPENSGAVQFQLERAAESPGGSTRRGIPGISSFPGSMGEALPSRVTPTEVLELLPHTRTPSGNFPSPLSAPWWRQLHPLGRADGLDSLRKFQRRS